MSRLCAKICLAVNAVGTLLSLSALIVFAYYGNYYAVVWCSIAVVLAALNTYIRGMHFIDKLKDWYSLSSIASIRDFGMCVGILISGFFGYIIFNVVYYQESIHAPIRDSKIIVAVWCFISAKYAFTLHLVVRQYHLELSETRLFLQE